MSSKSSESYDDYQENSEFANMLHEVCFFPVNLLCC